MADNPLLRFRDKIICGYYGLAVAFGFFLGHSVVDKFGLNPLITTASDPEDIWEGGGTYSFDVFGTAPILSIASNNAADTQVMKIQGLDINGTLTIQEITLQGITRVALTTPLWRVFRIENEGDEGEELTGTVFCYTGTGAVPSVGDLEVRAVVLPENNQTQMAIYTIPAGKVGFLFRGEFGVEFTGTVGAGTNFARVQYQSRRVGKIFKVKKTVSLVTLANSNYTDRRVFPDPIPALTDIKSTVAEVSDDMGVWATLDMLLVDEDKLPKSFLQNIDQPGS